MSLDVQTPAQQGGEVQAAGEGHMRVATGTQQGRRKCVVEGKCSKTEKRWARAGAAAGPASHHMLGCSSRLGHLIIM